MTMHKISHDTSSNRFLAFGTSKGLSNDDWHSIAVNDQQTSLLLIGSHALGLINLENIYSHTDKTIDSGTVLIPLSYDINKLMQLFGGECNTSRPIAVWNHSNPSQYAVAINRLVRFYTIEQSRVIKTNGIIDSQHQVMEKCI